MRLRSPSPLPIFFLILLAISAARSHQIADDHRKLVDDSIDQSKCGGCPCGNPCPTAPIYPSPPPPPPVYTPPPPPPRKSPSTGGGRSYCPPPPSNFIYITGPPGSLYPIDQTNGAAASWSFQAAMCATGVVATLFLFHHQF